MSEQRVHQSLTPWWDCAICGELWPCPTERTRLRQRFAGRPDELGRHLWREMEQAARYVGNPVELHQRFLAWAGHSVAATNTPAVTDCG